MEGFQEEVRFMLKAKDDWSWPKDGREQCSRQISTNLSPVLLERKLRHRERKYMVKTLNIPNGTQLAPSTALLAVVGLLRIHSCNKHLLSFYYELGSAESLGDNSVPTLTNLQFGGCSRREKSEWQL